VFLGSSIPTRDELGDGPRRPPRPPWLRNRLRTGPNYLDLKGLVRGLNLHTVCEEASCPNVYECWEAREATFLILGRLCTRRCGFCDISTGRPEPLDPDEPVRVAEAVERMGLRFAVVTGVERDDAPPQAVARIWAATIAAIRERVPECRVEVLTGDLKADPEAIAIVMGAEPDVFAHNLETPRRMHRTIRPGFRYDRSLDVLRQAKALKPRIPTKSNIIVGMGETFDEVVETLDAIDVDQGPRGGEAELHERNEALAASQGLGLVAVALEDRKRLVEGRWSVVLERRRVHRNASSRRRRQPGGRAGSSASTLLV